MNTVVFVPPQVAAEINDTMWNIIDVFTDLVTGLWNYGEVIEMLQAAKDLVDDLNQMIDDQVEGGCSQSYSLVPNAVEGEEEFQLLKFPPAPTKVNCSFVPQPGILIPISGIGGLGEPFMDFLVMKEAPGTCDCD